MRATKYTKRITIQTPIQVENEVGGFRNEWSTLYASWASVIPMNGYRKLQYGMNSNEEVYEVEIYRRLVNIGVNCRVVYGGNNYSIVGTPVITDETVKFEITRSL